MVPGALSLETKPLLTFHLSLSKRGALPPQTPEHTRDLVVWHRNHFNVPKCVRMAVRKFRKTLRHVTHTVITQKRVDLL